MGSSVTVLAPKSRKVPFTGTDLTRTAGSHSIAIENVSLGLGVAIGKGADFMPGGAVQLEKSVNGISHDVRNMLSALNLYCDLLAEPEVLSPLYRHYADDLRLVAQAGNSLLERLADTTALPQRLRAATKTFAAPESAETVVVCAEEQSAVLTTVDSGVCEAEPFTTAGDLDRCHHLLAALAGPSFDVSLECGSDVGPLPLSSEDLTRILINLVRNASEAMPNGGAIRIQMQAGFDASTGVASSLMLSVEDDGPGIAAEDLPHLFASGYTTKRSIRGKTSWLTPQLHGLGLSIVRGLVESAGGMVEASSPLGRGARFEITFPL